MKYLLVLLTFACNMVHAQNSRVEQEYLTKLAKSFGSTTIKAQPSKYFWSLCLGEGGELSNAALSNRINALIGSPTELSAFYKRLNYYVPSNISYRTGLLGIQEYVTITPVPIQSKRGKKVETAEQPYQAWRPAFTSEEMRVYLEYIASQGKDAALNSVCDAAGTTSSLGTSAGLPVPPPPPSSSSVSSDTSRKIFVFADEFPEFPGGETGLIKFLQQNTLYPQMERDNDIQGKVMIRFVVCETGKVSDIQVLRGVSPNLDMESVRVIRMLPRFKPGKVKGEPVRVYYNLPFVFKLQ